MKKWFVWVVLLVIISLVWVGCSKSQKETETNKPLYDPIDLTMYLVGEKPEDADLVYEEVNKLLKEDLNTKLTVNFISWSDYIQKYPFYLASGVGVDLIYTGDWCFYDSEARKGAFHEITEADIQNYMPLTWKNAPEEGFEQAKIDGKMYMIPNNQVEYASYKLVAIRGDLREKYGLPPIESIEDLETYYQAVAANEKDMIPYDASVDNQEIAAINFWQKNQLIQVSSGLSTTPFAVRYEGLNTDYKLLDIFEMPEYWAYIEQMQSWHEQGFWSPNAVSNKVAVDVSFEQGKSASLVWHLGTLALSYIKMMQTHPEWKPEIVDLTPDAVRTIAKYTNNGMAVSAKSPNYERALMVLDRLRNDQRYWNLTWLGIEGKHWEAVDEATYKPLADAYKFSYAATSCWGWGNVPFQKTSINSPAINRTYLDKWPIKTVTPITEFFRFNDSNVKTQLVACQGVLDKYQVALELGMITDVKGMKESMLKALDKAGWQVVKEAFTNQYNDFLKNQKNY